MSDPPGDGQLLPAGWRATPADDDLRRSYQQADFDDGAWSPIDVPGHWQRQHEALREQRGPVLHRTRWTSPELGEDERAWLVFDGIMYQSDVWFDGEYLGDTEGYFFPHAFEVTEHLGARRDHVVAAEVSCHPPSDLRNKRNLTGVFQHAEWLDRSLDPGGIWRPVRLERSGPVRILHGRALCVEADATRAVLSLRVVVHAESERRIRVRTRVCGAEHELDHQIAAGENQLEWSVVLPDPDLWWPWSLGDATLHDLEVAVLLDDGVRSDRRTCRVGLRSIELDAYRCSINGERLFLKGTGLGPVSYWLAEADGDAHRRDLAGVRDAGLDLVRVEGHIGRPELYDTADELGLLVWQDLPLQWGYHRSVRTQAVRQAREAVDLLGHHPSIVVWCGHNEPTSVRREPMAGSLAGRRHRQRLEWIDQELPTYNRTILDRSIGRTLRRADASRPIVFHGGALPSLPRLDGTDNRLALGWERGHERSLPALCQAFPRLARFVSGIGSAAVPPGEPGFSPARWPDLDWDDLSMHRGADRGAFETYVPPAAFDDAATWAAATRAYQADVVRFHVETLRRLKYRPTGGFAVALWAAPLPGATRAMLAHDRTPLPAHAALAAACRPVIAVADRPPHHLHPGEPIDWAVHVVSDLRRALAHVRVEARLRATRTDECTVWEGDVPPDACVRVGTVRSTAPDETTPLTLDLTLRYDDVEQTTRYETVVLAGPHDHDHGGAP